MSEARGAAAAAGGGVASDLSAGPSPRASRRNAAPHGAALQTDPLPSAATGGPLAAFCAKLRVSMPDTGMLLGRLAVAALVGS